MTYKLLAIGSLLSKLVFLGVLWGLVIVWLVKLWQLFKHDIRQTKKISKKWIAKNFNAND